MPTLSTDSQYFMSVLNERIKKELGSKKLYELPIDEARKKIGNLLAPDSNEHVKLPELDVAVGSSSIKYEHNDTTVKLPITIYAPKDHDEELPVVMYFHGGGFALGDSRLIDFGCQYLAQHLQCRVVSVDYRKSPEYRFPTAHYDAYFATEYVATHPEEFKSNGVIAVAGDSAGGNLAASVCHLAKASERFNIAFQFLIYPWSDLNNDSSSDHELAHGYYLEIETLNWMTSLYINTPDDKNNPLASPKLRHNFQNLPPAYVVIGDADPILDDARTYADKLKAGGNEVVYRELPGIIHDFCVLPTFFTAVLETFAEAVTLMKKHVK